MYRVATMFEKGIDKTAKDRTGSILDHFVTLNDRVASLLEDESDNLNKNCFRD